MVRAADNNFELPHSGYDESLDDDSLLGNDSLPSAMELNRLNEDIRHPPIYEPLSDDIQVIPDLQPQQYPLAFSHHAFNYRDWPNKSTSNSSHPSEVQTLLPLPPDNYVQFPLPPSFSIGSHTDSAIDFYSDGDSQIDISSPFDESVEIDLSDGEANDAALAVAPNEDSDVEIDISSCEEEKALPEESDVEIELYDDSGDEVLSSKNGSATALTRNNPVDELDDIYVSDEEVPLEIGAAGSSLRPYTSADFSGFNNEWLGN